LEVLCFCRKTLTQRTESQQVQRRSLGVLFGFMSLMKSLPKVARTEVLQRNITDDWSVKDQTSCKENLHLGPEDDIIKMVQVEGAKCINTCGSTGAKGRLNRPGWGWTGRPKPASLAHSGCRFGLPFLAPKDPWTLSCWRHRHSQDREPFAWEAIHKLEINGSMSSTLMRAIFSFVHGL
jgi:hypothetical protein